MKTFITLAIILALLTATSASSFESAMKQLLEQKTRMVKSAANGEDYHPSLQAHGSGITDGQETTALNHIDQAYQTFSTDIYANALYIQQKVEESFGGRWNVEVFGNDPSWGRATHITRDQWILLFGYG